MRLTSVRQARSFSLLLVGFSLLLSLLSEGAFADDFREKFTEANRLYEKGEYTEAIALYTTIVGAQRHSPALHFNLGNAYFKNSELGHAIYHYRLAELLAPRDPDIRANLSFARDRVTGSASVEEPFWHRAVRYFTINELAVATILLFWILLSLLALARLRPSLRTMLKTYLILDGAILAVLLLTLGISLTIRSPQAIALRNQLTVNLGPLTESQAAFTVPDGTELMIENRRDNWIQVADRSNRTGWVETNQVAILP